MCAPAVFTIPKRSVYIKSHFWTDVNKTAAAPDSWFSHLAVEVPGTETSNEWLEAVSDEKYGKLK